VYRSHGGTVWRAVLAMSAGNRDVADEAQAEAFARLFAYRDGVRDPVAWVYRTAFGVARRQLGEKRRIATEAIPETPAPPSALPSDLTATLNALSADQRVVVFLHYFADLPVREIARLSGSPVATVKVRLHRARKTLRETLAGAGGEYV
jgi:RNA polymerase sigma-70 factor (ECF subfamily)